MKIDRNFTMPIDEAMDRLQKRGIPAGAVIDNSELSEDPHLQARGFFVRADDATTKLFPGVPGRSGGGTTVRTRGPDLAEHNHAVIAGLLCRPVEDVPIVDENEIGTGFDP